MKSALLVPFGLKDGRLYEPTQVPNGKDCGCVCPGCKCPLVAKQKAKTPHFAHSNDENCSNGLETAVHLAVKQIIAEKMMIRLPALFWTSPLPKSNPTSKIYIENIIKLKSVILEQSLGDFKPDIIVTDDNNTNYLVEVAVTHFIDNDKQKKINLKKIPTFEIDVSSLKMGFTLVSLEKALFHNFSYLAEWKYHPKSEELDLNAKLEQEKIISNRRDIEREKQWKFERYRNSPSEKKLKINLNAIGLTREKMNDLSTFVPWDNSFSVPRIVWQSAVLAYIAKIQQTEGLEESLACTVNSNECLNWMRNVFNISSKVKDGEKIAVWKYFKYLEEIGILKYIAYNEFDLLVDKTNWNNLKKPT